MRAIFLRIWLRSHPPPVGITDVRVRADAYTPRYERRSVLVTSNLAFSEWPKVLSGDDNATIISTKGKSYRMRRRSG